MRYKEHTEFLQASHIINELVFLFLIGIKCQLLIMQDTNFGEFIFFAGVKQEE